MGLSGLFRPLPKSGSRPTLDIAYDLGEGVQMRFRAHDALGIPEQTLLLAVLEIAQEQYSRRPGDSLMSHDDRSEDNQALWDLLHRSAVPQGCRTVKVKTTWEELNRRCGTGNGGSLIKTRRASLKRLCEVTVWEERSSDKGIQQSYLLALATGDGQGVTLALNYRLASCIFGMQYVQVCLAERLHLATDVAMAVHAYLSARIRKGHDLRVGVATIVQRLWPRTANLVVPTSSERRQARVVRLALNAVGRLPGWAVEWDASTSIASVRRLRTAVREMTSTRQSVASQASFGGQSLLENNNKINDLTQLDASGLFTTNG